MLRVWFKHDAWYCRCSPVLMHSIRYCPFLMVSGMSGRWLNVLVLVLSPLSRPWYPLVRAGRVHNMLLLKVGMRATRGHILQEVVMHVIGIILEKHFQKKELLKQGKGVSNERGASESSLLFLVTSPEETLGWRLKNNREKKKKRETKKGEEKKKGKKWMERNTLIRIKI